MELLTRKSWLMVRYPCLLCQVRANALMLNPATPASEIDKHHGSVPTSCVAKVVFQSFPAVLEWLRACYCCAYEVGIAI